MSAPKIKRSDDKALQQAAHLYVDAADRSRHDNAKALRDKSIATIRLQMEALRYAADFMEHWTSTMLDAGDQYIACAPGVAQLRESALDAEFIMKEMEKRR